MAPLLMGVAQELNYSPNRVARALRTAKTYTVGVVSFDVSDPMATASASQLERELAGHGYRTTVGDARHDAIHAIDHVRDFLTSGADGIALLASSYRPDANRLVEMQRQRGVPIVCMFRDLSEGGIQSFVVDYRRGARDITKHLLEVGYHRIAVIVGAEMYEPDSTDRLEGARQACTEYGIEIAPQMIVRDTEGGWTPHTGYRSMKQLLAIDPLPEAVVAFDDVTAYGAIRAIYEAGKRVPDDIAVVGFDDLAVSAFFNPALTTVRQPVGEVAAAAAEYLVKRMGGHLTEESPDCLQFEPLLVMRASVCQMQRASDSDTSRGS